MAFQPFGYPFEIRSHLGVAAAKTAIREARTNWFDVNNGPRGWIVGPYVCLWNSALNRSGPMVLARISAERGSTRIKGRAGSDLNGTLALTFWALLLLPLIVLALRDGESLDDFAVIIGLMVIGVPLALWLANNDKRDADSLVRFLGRTVGPRRAKIGEQSSDPVPTVRVAIDGKGLNGVITSARLDDAVARLSVDSFIILERGPQHYMQVLSRADDFLLEKREGSANHHFQLSLSKGVGVDDPRYGISERAVVDALTNYLFGRNGRPTMEWQQFKPR